MSLSTFLKIVNKAFKFTISRPLQRFNIEDRSVKYLGPDSKKWQPSPRAIGPISGLSLKELPKYPHLTPGYKSISQKRRDAIESGKSAEEQPVQAKLKSYSEDKEDDNLVIEALNKIDVIKTVARVGPTLNPKQIESGYEQQNTNIGDETDGQLKPSHRPLPKLTDLPRQDLRSIWEVERTPPGRMNLNMLQELMINKLADHVYWTSKAIAERYNIREEYADKLVSSLKQIRIRLSPRMAKNMDYVGRMNPEYMAMKDLIYHVDKSMRTELDKKYDSMYSPKDDLPDDVRQLIDSPGALQLPSKQGLTAQREKYERPAPLRLAPSNVKDPSQVKPKIKQNPEELKKLEAPKHPRFRSDD